MKNKCPPLPDGKRRTALFRFALIPDADQYSGKVSVFLQEGLEAGTEKIRPVGIPEGIVSHKALIRIPEGYEMCANLMASMPVIE